MVKMLVAGMGCNCRAVQNAQFAMQMSSISSSANARCQQMAPPRNENTFMARSVCTVRARGEIADQAGSVWQQLSAQSIKLVY